MEQKFSATEVGRLDHFLAKHLGVASHQVLQCIKAGCVRVNSKICHKGGVKLKVGDAVVFTPPKTQETPAYAPLEFEVIYEDADILVINKPPNLVVHPASGVRGLTLLDHLKAKGYTLSTLSGEWRCGIVHRLDKDTSGAILVAKTNAAHAHLAAQLKSKEMGRYYLAILSTPLSAPTKVECNLGRHPKNRLKMTNLNALRQEAKGGKWSKSAFMPLATSSKGQQLIAIKLYSGRTHQIRAHLESLNRHIVGDPLYGQADSYNGRILLHAYLLYCTHPKTGQRLLFKAQILPDMLEYLKTDFQEVSWDGFLQERCILDLFGADS
ncbi:RluA family pseudouridine synthase [Helicobacter ailurogastricus]|uniref:Pseudouridine synthase n=1 Tax=Helicobacter ailurogastricus TaxID=1578720 RepID=A0A0K2X2T2_9HELI|nr:RluA family pseudouridine synthase [Helicobacter ailurogastricus]CRF41030.1 Ribosomal large subunit pseudouridine synthase D [Helicobacter ailurogastricus]CRF42318.1 Ribosomal large subunit pseudouridine synthase D [Helicobacter ailurogastricus]CRF44784.1 Ribosomal large subunit pseudouridine synthase D [Helicobacter ailurogastricus]CRF51995.1 Ribosomal large subunit pseudouridine synthase D [Helicobacter ailurogastricus]BDQ29108.1 putative RNA pseudouridine synthase [Helicobacter ailurogas